MSDQDVTRCLSFDAQGLIPAVVQDAESGQVLMVAYMDEEAVRRTLAEGRTWFYSRSRKAYWRKGDTSGHIQRVRQVRTDCDRDCLLVLVEQVGAACHLGYRSCFAHVVSTAGVETVERPIAEAG